MMDLGNPFIVLSMTLVGTACCITLVAHSIHDPTVLALAVGITGFGVAGSQNSLNTVSGMLYPTAIRSTGVGWSMGIGRIGSIVGPMLGGVLVAAQWDVTMIINLQAIPALIAAICVLGLPRLRPAEDRAAALRLAGAGQ
jgi:MFS transporter, AAHS family, 4-hydroxybenzoate transporter